jgi:hypothetical protein
VQPPWSFQTTSARCARLGVGVPSMSDCRAPRPREQYGAAAYDIVPFRALLPQVSPKGDLVLAKVADVENKTAGGILLPTAAQRRPTSGAGAAPQTAIHCATMPRHTIHDASRPVAAL